jgi:hypothetical protein
VYDEDGKGAGEVSAVTNGWTMKSLACPVKNIYMRWEGDRSPQ